MVYIATAVLGAVAICPLACASETLRVDARTLNEHVVTRVPLVYPAIAKAAQVQGTVVLEVKVSEDGKVVSERAVSGPPMLIQEAIDSVRGWKFRPFEENGVRVSASGQVSLIFLLGDANQPPPPKEVTAARRSGSEIKTVFIDRNDSGILDPKVATKYLPLWNECTRRVLAHQNDIETAKECQKAAEEADKFPSGQGLVMRRLAYVYAAAALANVGDLKQALANADKAVAVVKLGHDDESGDNAAYSARGHIRAFLGDMEGADQDLDIAENCERKVVISAQKESPDIAPGYQHVLQSDLRFHAEVLKRINRPEDAQKKLDEAAKL